MIQDWTYTGGILYLDLLSTAYTHNMSVIAGNITPQTVVVYQTAGQNFTALPVLAVSDRSTVSTGTVLRSVEPRQTSTPWTLSNPDVYSVFRPKVNAVPADHFTSDHNSGEYSTWAVGRTRGNVSTVLAEFQRPMLLILRILAVSRVLYCLTHK